MGNLLSDVADKGASREEPYVISLQCQVPESSAAGYEACDQIFNIMSNEAKKRNDDPLLREKFMEKVRGEMVGIELFDSMLVGRRRDSFCWITLGLAVVLLLPVFFLFLHKKKNNNNNNNDFAKKKSGWEVWMHVLGTNCAVYWTHEVSTLYFDEYKWYIFRIKWLIHITVLLLL